MFIPSGYYRRKALAALKGHWQPALLVALIVNLPTMLMQGFSMFTGNDLMDRLGAFIVSASRDGILTQQTLLQEINTIVASTAFWLIRGLEILAMLVTPCLSLGMYKWLMDLLHGQEQPLNSVFSRMKYFFKALGLELLVILKVLLKHLFRNLLDGGIKKILLLMILQLLLFSFKIEVFLKCLFF